MPPKECHNTLGAAGDRRGLLMGASVQNDLLGVFNHYTSVHSHEYAIGGSSNWYCTWSMDNYPTAVLAEKATERGITLCKENAAYTAAAKMKFRGETLVYPQAAPSWYKDVPVADALARLDKHVSSSIIQTAAIPGVSVYSWDVVGFMLEQKPATAEKPLSWALPDESPLSYLFGTGKDVTKALVDLFKLAAKANDGGDTKLCYVDGGFTETNKAAAGLVALVKELKRMGAPIDCIAWALRQDYDKALSMDETRKIINELASAGVEVHLTSVEVRCIPCTDDVAAERQALVYRDMVEACTLEQDCTVFQTDGFHDLNTQASELPFAADMTKRPAYHKMLDLLNRRTCTDNRTPPPASLT